MAARRPFAVVISGRGGNMAAIVHAAQTGAIPVDVVGVFADRAAPGIEIAQAAGVAAHVIPSSRYASREDFDAALATALIESGAEFIALAGFMRILTPAFVEQFTGRLLNIHPSLLPKYKGLHTHRRAIEAGDTEHGASVHFVTAELDGGPVIAQARVPIAPHDTSDTLSARVHAVEHMLYPRVCGLVAAGRVRLQDGSAWFDGAPLGGTGIDLKAMETR
jgi:phosphoribosylglycinamide formyltransferase 1